MKQFTTMLILIGAILFSSTIIADTRAILLEFGFGFGKSGSVEYSNDEQKTLNLSLCRNRNSGRMQFIALRYRQDNVELHGATWWHDNEIATCNRDSYAVGLGYVFSSEDADIEGQEDLYLTWTPGIAYTWNDNKTFKNQTEDNTNYRLVSNFQIFNRVAVGAGNRNMMVEVAAHRYGAFEQNHGENFVTIGLGLKDLEDNRKKAVVTDTEDDDDHPSNSGCNHGRGNGTEGCNPGNGNDE